MEYKSINIDLGKEIKKINLYCLSDLHIGDPLCNLKKIKEVMLEIKKNPNTYIILNGDLINNATTSSVSDSYSECMKPLDELKMIVDLLEPIKNRILLISNGNHEDRTYKTDGIDLTELIAMQLGLQDRYVNGLWYLFLTFGWDKKKNDRQIQYCICGLHGFGGGRKLGGKANNLVELSNIAVADLYCMGHTHTPIATRNSILMPDKQHKSLVMVDKYYLMTNSFLDYGGYGAKYGFTPISNDALQYAELDGTKKNIKIII